MIISKISPDITPIAYNSPIIFRFSFLFSFVLNNTNNPTPAFTHNPEINIGIDITFSTNNSVNTTDDAQFGINPIIPATIGPNIIFLLTIFARFSWPIISIIPFITSVMIMLYFFHNDNVRVHIFLLFLFLLFLCAIFLLQSLL